MLMVSGESEEVSVLCKILLRRNNSKLENGAGRKPDHKCVLEMQDYLSLAFSILDQKMYKKITRPK